MHRKMVKSDLISGGHIRPEPDLKIWPDFGRAGARYDIRCNPIFYTVILNSTLQYVSKYINKHYGSFISAVILTEKMTFSSEQETFVDAQQRH